MRSKPKPSQKPSKPLPTIKAVLPEQGAVWRVQRQPLPLTQRQTEILDFIVTYTAKNAYPPTIREIGDAAGIVSTNGVFDHLAALARKGFITRETSKARSIVVLKRKDGSPNLSPLQTALALLFDALDKETIGPNTKKLMAKVRKLAGA